MDPIMLRHNPGAKEKHQIIDQFVIRIDLFEKIFKDIKNWKIDKHSQSYLFIGQRGAGKTTLIYRIKYAVEDDNKINEWLIPIIFPEEQYDINELANVWEKIIEYLEEAHGWKDLHEKVDAISNTTKGYESKIFSILEESLVQKNKVVLIGIENLNSLFKKFTKEDRNRFKNIFTKNTRLRLFASTTSLNDGTINFGNSEYEYLKKELLESLSLSETKSLLLKISEQFNQEETINKIFKISPRRLEALKRLTGGVPRTMTYLFKIFLDNENGKAIKDLKQLVDDLSLMYKAKLDELSSQQQKIIDTIAKAWDPITTKEIASKTRIDSKYVSSILQQLEKNQLIEIIETRTKNHLYRIKERFLNIWYLLRFGKKNTKSEVLWLVRFYETWCDKTELARRISLHINNLKTGEYDVNSALLMGTTFLACNKVPGKLKYDLLQSTMSILPKDLHESLSIADIDLNNAIDESLAKNEVQDARMFLDQIKNKEDLSYTLVSVKILLAEKNYLEANKLLEEVFVTTQSKEAAKLLADINDSHLHNYSKALYYYEFLLKEGDFEAAHEMGHLYAEKIQNYEKAEEYFNMAIDNNIEYASLCCGSMLEEMKRYTEAEKYFSLAVESGLSEGYNYLGMLHKKLNDEIKAKNYFQEGSKKGDVYSILNLGNIYLTQEKPDIGRAKKQFELGIKQDNHDAYYAMGRLYYYRLDNPEHAKKYLIKAIEKGNVSANHTLAHLYEKQNDLTNAERFFKQAIMGGDLRSIYCLTDMFIQNNLETKNRDLLDMYEQNIHQLREDGIESVVFHSLVLAWNNNISGAVENIANYKESFDSLFKRAEENENNNDIEPVISALIEFFKYLIAWEHLDYAVELFRNRKYPPFKKILKPMYYALMFHMKDKFPNEYLKVGDELKETVQELIEEIKKAKKKNVKNRR